MVFNGFRQKPGKQLYLLLGFVALSVLFSCSANHWAEQLDWKELSLESLPDSADYPTAHALVLLDEGQVSIEGQGEIRLTHFDRHKVVRILDRGGLAYCNVVIPYTPGSSTVEKIKARTIHPDGRITVLDEKQIFDIFLYPDFIFYADQKAKKFTFPDAEPGDVIEYRYHMIFENLTLYHSWSFQDFIPVLRSRFEVSFPSSWKLHHKVYHYPLQPDSVKRPSGFKTIYRWQVHDMPALEREPAMPPIPDVAAYLLFAPLGFEKWQDVANWYFDLSKERMKPNAELKRFTESLVNGSDDDWQKLEKIYNWVRDHIRYVAIAIGIGSYQPHFAADVFKNRYGDCKDMVTLLCAMGRAADLTIDPVLVSTRQNGRLDTSLATPFRFNHVVARAQLPDGRQVYLDPTHKGAPFGYLPWYLQNVYGLVVKETDRFELVRIQPDSGQNNLTDIKGQVDWDHEGKAIGKLNFTYYGAPAVQLRAALLASNAADQKRWLENFLCQLDVPFQLKDFKINGIKNFSDSLSLRVKLVLESGNKEEAQGGAFVPGKLMEPELWRLFRSPARVHPVQFGYRFKRKMNLVLNFPQGWQVKGQPVSQAIATTFGTGELKIRKDDSSRLNVTGQFILEKITIPPADYQAFRSFLDQTHQLFAQPVLLKH